MKRTTQIITFLLVLILTLTGCSQRGTVQERSEDEYQTIELTMAVNGTDTQMDSRVANHFADLVAERSGGNVTVAVFPNAQLAGGNASKGIEMFAMGSVDLASYATCTLAVIDKQ